MNKEDFLMHTYELVKEYPTGATRYRCAECNREIVTHKHRSIALVDGNTDAPHCFGSGKAEFASGELVAEVLGPWRGFLEGLQ